jgi:hypothetical protein
MMIQVRSALLLSIFVLSTSAMSETGDTITVHRLRKLSKMPCQRFNGWKQTRMANVVRDPKVHRSNLAAAGNTLCLARHTCSDPAALREV